MPKHPDRLAGFSLNQFFIDFNPNVSAELNTATPDFQYCKPWEKETYLHAEIHPCEYTAFIHKARRTLLLFGFLCFLLFAPIEKGGNIKR